ncbi:Nascent polypeptide-associated complex subunit beta [Smittium mucronatum]|uniref:Nascent polypeptide-associated complex subunit beta n=1 Tax=Smittium mucronatum TaxID=133383 RepID=A0A1R0GVJ4_9FUNG|nr:Nascent polypeptide-associated complex subunit beta [Smittium mucronatum]
MNPQKLAQLQSQARIGGKGTPRRKVFKSNKPAATEAAGSDDKKLAATLKKMNAQPLAGVEEVNMFRDDGKVVHFTNPKVSATSGANSFIINGEGQVKEIADLFPGILSQLGPDSLDGLRRLAEEIQAKNPEAFSGKDAAEEDIPDLIETIDSLDIKKDADEVD